MSFSIVYNFKHSLRMMLSSVFKRRILERKNKINYGTAMFIFLQVVVCQSLPDDSVNGIKITRRTRRWIPNTQWLNNSGIQQTLRAKTLDRHAVPLTHPNIYFTKLSTRTQRFRTTVFFESAKEPCHYLVMNCLRAYQTGKICASTTFNNYFTFKNYCMLDYTNCVLGTQVWRSLHMGDCFQLRKITSFVEISDWSSGMMQGVYVPDTRV